MFFPFLMFSMIGFALVKLGALIVWIQILTLIVKFAMLMIGVLVLMLLWQSLRRR